MTEKEKEKEDTIYLSSSINELFAITEVTQFFSNPLDSPIELSITFPILNEISLSKFTVTIGEKIIVSKVLTKEKAKEKYNDSISSGNTGIISTYKESLKYYLVNIGNILSKQKIKLSTSFIQMIGSNDMSYEFKIIENYPMFKCDKLNDKETKYKIIVVNLNLETQSKITRLIAPFMTEEEKVKSKYEVHFENDYKSANIKYIKNFNENNYSKSTLEEYFKDKINKHIFLSTFCILFRTEKMNEPTLYYQYNEKLNETSYSINYVFSSKSLKSLPLPSEPDQDNKISYCYKYQDNLINDTPGIFIFLIDQSGSMSGKSIDLVRKSLLLFIQSLPAGSYFQLIGFGSNFRKYNKEPVEYNIENVNKIINKINNLNADMGGTNISGPLENIYNSKDHLEVNLCKNILVLTDGEVFDRERCIKVVKTNCEKYRLHAIGIGSSFDRQLIEECGKYGKGSSSFIEDVEKVNLGVIEALNMCLRPYLIDIKFNFINYENNNKNSIISYGPINKFTYQDEIINYSFILNDKNKIDIDNLSEPIKIEIEAKNPINIIKENFSFIKNENIIKLSNGDEMAKMIIGKALKFNKELIEDEKKEIEFSKKYQILSKNTALFAEIINDSENAEQKKLIQININHYNKMSNINYYGSSMLPPMPPTNMGISMGMNSMYNNYNSSPIHMASPQMNMGFQMMNQMNIMGPPPMMNNMNSMNQMNMMGPPPMMNNMNSMNQMNMMNNMNMMGTPPMMNNMNSMNQMNMMGANMNQMNIMEKKKEINIAPINEKKLTSLKNKENININVDKIIMNQDIIEGSWNEDDETNNLINIINKDKYNNICQRVKSLNKGDKETKILYTIVVIYYLTTEHSNKINEYKLVINKAKKFLLKYGINYDELSF